MKYMRIETAGRLVRGVIYSMVTGGDSSAARAGKRSISSEARKKMNLKTSQQKLECRLAANFDRGDLLVTLTYRQEALPSSREEARTRWRRFLAQLRDAKKARGRETGPLRYIYVTEGFHGDHRWHHHVVIRAEDAREEDIRALWSVNGDNVDITYLDGMDYGPIAQYLTKEALEHGCPRVGEQMWTPSKGLEKPRVEFYRVADNCSLTIPSGAVMISRDDNRNAYGDFVYIKYLLPAGEPARPSL